MGKSKSSEKGFSVGKIAVGGILLGLVGLGMKKAFYSCDKCSFSMNTTLNCQQRRSIKVSLIENISTVYIEKIFRRKV